jgi:hypothetical protein
MNWFQHFLAHPLCQRQAIIGRRAVLTELNQFEMFGKLLHGALQCRQK